MIDLSKRTVKLPELCNTQRSPQILLMMKTPSLRKHPFLLALRSWERFARRDVCDSGVKIPYTDDANQCLYNKSGSHGGSK